MNGLHLGVLLIFGIGVFGGILGAWGFQRLRMPQVVGYIVIGLILGDSALGLIHQEDAQKLEAFSLFALGIIGFLVGGELQADNFRKYGRQYLSILVGEGVLAFLLVGAATGAVIYVVSGSATAAAACGVVLGAIASATDPASTVGVLWEYRARGILTTCLIAIVALDDALALVLYGAGASSARMLSGGSAGFLHELQSLALDLGGAVVIGVLGGLLLAWLLRYGQLAERSLALALGLILLIIGACAAAGMDVIIATMALGLVLVNRAPRRSGELFKLMRSFSAPIYAMFFVLVGAGISVRSMPSWLWLLVALYVLGRTAGKYFGAAAGAWAGGAEAVIRRYTGMGLLAQGGVAVGLSIMASQHLGEAMVAEDLSAGQLVVFVVTATTLIVQLGGPPMVKLAIRRSGEIGRNVTEEDVLAEMSVGDVMAAAEAIPEHEPLRAVLRRFAQTEHLVYPVVREDGDITGILKLETLKDVLPNRDAWDWLVAADVAEPPGTTAPRTSPLRDALDLMRDANWEQLLVTDENDRPIGILDRRVAQRRVKEEVLRRQHGAFAEGAAAV